MLTTLIYSLFALDQTLAALAAEHAVLMFAALFLVIFAETGLVIFPLLPGDSLLFVAGTVVAATTINIHLLVLTLFAGAGVLCVWWVRTGLLGAGWPHMRGRGGASGPQAAVRVRSAT